MLAGKFLAVLCAVLICVIWAAEPALAATAGRDASMYLPTDVSEADSLSSAAAHQTILRITSPRSNELMSHQLNLNLKWNIDTTVLTPPLDQYNIELRAVCLGHIDSETGRDLHLPFIGGNNYSLPDAPQSDYIDSMRLIHCGGDNLQLTVALWNDATGAELIYDRVVVRLTGDVLASVYLGTSALSFLSSLVVVYLFLAYPELQRFPSNIVFLRSLVDLIFSGQTVFTSMAQLATGGERVCNAFFAFLTQFCLLSSLNWYFVLTVNFYVSISNPFRRPQSNMTVYHVLAWGTAFFTGIATSSNYDYRPDLQLCWNAKNDGTGINIFNWLGYYVWLYVFALASIIIFLMGNYKLKNVALRATLATRERSLMQTRTYVIIFTLYWLLAGSLWASVYFRTSATGTNILQNQALSITFVFFGGLFGFVDFVAWLITQWPDLKRIRESKRHMKALAADFAQQVAASDGVIPDRDLHMRSLDGRMSTDRLSVTGSMDGGARKFSPDSSLSPLASPAQSDADLTMAAALAAAGGRKGGDGGEDVARGKNDESMSDISDALRYEFIMYTSIGIQRSIGKCAREARRIHAEKTIAAANAASARAQGGPAASAIAGGRLGATSISFNRLPTLPGDPSPVGPGAGAAPAGAEASAGAGAGAGAAGARTSSSSSAAAAAGAAGSEGAPIDLDRGISAPMPSVASVSVTAVADDVDIARARGRTVSRGMGGGNKHSSRYDPDLIEATAYSTKVHRFWLKSRDRDPAAGASAAPGALRAADAAAGPQFVTTTSHVSSVSRGGGGAGSASSAAASSRPRSSSDTSKDPLLAAGDLEDPLAGIAGDIAGIGPGSVLTAGRPAATSMSVNDRLGNHSSSSFSGALLADPDDYIDLDAPLGDELHSDGTRADPLDSFSELDTRGLPKERSRALSAMSAADPSGSIEGSGYTFFAYAPLVFHKLRRVFGIKREAEHAMSMDGDVATMTRKFSEGASGSFFYFTPDNKYMVKTLTSGEKDLLLKILPQYYAYMRDNPKSLICRFYGLYSIKMYDHKEYFVVMNNVLRMPAKGITIDETYDLKGSRIARHAKQRKTKGVKGMDPHQRRGMKPVRAGTLKDNDLKKSVRISANDRAMLEDQLAADSSFLCSQNIMDYSLLLGIHNVTLPKPKGLMTRALVDEDGNEKKQPGTYSASFVGARPLHVRSASTTSLVGGVSMSGMASASVSPMPVPTEAVVMDATQAQGANVNPFPLGIDAEVITGSGVYFMGIIDVLQEWTWSKRLEQWAKIIFQCHCKDWEDLSAVEPLYYSERFKSMSEGLFESYD